MKYLLLSALLLAGLATGCKSSDPTPATPAPTAGVLVGNWYLDTEDLAVTPQNGPTLTGSKLYPHGQYAVSYTTTTFQSYASGPSAKTFTYSLSGSTYTYMDGSTSHTVQIAELTNARLVTKDAYMSGTTSVVLTSTLTH